MGITRLGSPQSQVISHPRWVVFTGNKGKANPIEQLLNHDRHKQVHRDHRMFCSVFLHPFNAYVFQKHLP